MNGDTAAAAHPESVRSANATALAVPAEALGDGSGCRCEVVADADALTQHFAAAMVAEVRAAQASGRPFAVFIVPVGPRLEK